MMEANSGDTSTTPLISPPTQILLCPFCLLNPPPSSSTMVSSVVLTKGFLTQLPVAEGGGTVQEDAQGVYVESGSMGGMKRRVAVFWHQIARSPTPPTPSFLWFYGLLTGSHLAMSGDLWQICCRDSDRGSRRKWISSRATVLDRMTQEVGGGGTCRLWGNLTPLGGPFSCEHWAHTIVQKIDRAAYFKGRSASNQRIDSKSMFELWITTCYSLDVLCVCKTTWTQSFSFNKQQQKCPKTVKKNSTCSFLDQMESVRLLLYHLWTHHICSITCSLVNLGHGRQFRHWSNYADFPWWRGKRKPFALCVVLRQKSSVTH